MMTWRIVRNFGAVKYFGISYVVLFAVPIFLEVYTWAVTSSSMLAETWVFPPTLRWAYAASFCFAIAVAVYQIGCPEIIKRFGTVEEYIRDQNEFYLRSNPHHRAQIVRTRLHRDTDAASLERLEQLEAFLEEAADDRRPAIRRELDEFLAGLYSHSVQAYLNQEYDSMDQSYPVLRWLSGLLFVLGIVILFVLFVLRSVPVLSLG